MIAFLDGQDKVAPGRSAAVGHCMSGPFAVTAAARFPAHESRRVAVQRRAW